MRFELRPGAVPDGYGEGLWPLADAKARLRVDHDDEDELIAALRDAAIDLVEQYTGTFLAERPEVTWRAAAFPASGIVKLGVRPVGDIASVQYLDSDGTARTAIADDFMIEVHDRLVPKPGKAWPSDAAAGCTVTFAAGFADGECPRGLLEAVAKLTTSFYDNRDAVIIGTISSEMPFGVQMLCNQHRHWKV